MRIQLALMKLIRSSSQIIFDQTTFLVKKIIQKLMKKNKNLAKIYWMPKLLVRFSEAKFMIVAQ